MRLPFGIDAKSFIFGLIFAYFVLPMLLKLLSGNRATKTA